MALFNKRPNFASSVDVAPIGPSQGQPAQGAPGFVPPDRPITDQFLRQAQAQLAPADTTPLSNRQRGSLAVLGGFNPSLLPATTQALANNNLGAFADTRQAAIDQQQLQNLEAAAVREQALAQADDQLQTAALERDRTRVTIDMAKLSLEETRRAIAEARRREEAQIEAFPAFLQRNSAQTEEFLGDVDAYRNVLARAGTTEALGAIETLDSMMAGLTANATFLANENVDPEIRAVAFDRTDAIMGSMLDFMSKNGALGAADALSAAAANAANESLKLTAFQQKEISEGESFVQTLDAITELTNAVPGIGGAVAGLLPDISFLPGSSERAQLDAMIAQVNSLFLPGRFGANLAENEEIRAKGLIPSLTDRPERLATKLAELRRFAIGKLASIKNSGNLPDSIFQLEDLQTDTRAQSKGIIVPEGVTSAPSRVLNDPDLPAGSVQYGTTVDESGNQVFAFRTPDNRIVAVVDDPSVPLDSGRARRQKAPPTAQTVSGLGAVNRMERGRHQPKIGPGRTILGKQTINPNESPELKAQAAAELDKLFGGLGGFAFGRK